MFDTKILEPEIFILSEKYLKSIIDQITDDQWDMVVGERVSQRQPELTLRQLVNYHAYDDVWVPETLAGKTIAEVGDAHDGDLLGDDPKASYAKINADAQLAVGTLTDLDAVVHLTYGDFTARDYLQHITTYRGFQAWSVARFIRVDDTMPADLVDGMYQEIIPHIDAWRNMGVFGEPSTEPRDADKQTKLLCATGFWYEP